MKLKRFIAYIIDIFIVSFIATGLSSIEVINPYYDKYLDSYEEYQEVITSEDIESKIYSSEFKEIFKNINKYGSISSIISISCYLLYFVGFQKWNKNQTVGKKLMKIKVVSKDSKDVKLWQYLLRSIIVYNLLFNLLIVIESFILSSSLFFTISIITSIIGYVVTDVCVLMIIIRKDNLGLHDYLSKTEVVEV